MNAVNLIPSDARGRRLAISASRPTLALFGGMVVLLAAAVLYVSAANTVTARRADLARVTTAASSWTAAANSYAALVKTAQQRAQQLADVRQLVAGRYAWSQLLSQIGGLMPAAAALNSLTATTTPGTTPAAPPQPTVGLTGCAASQSTVAQVMVQLHRVTGVTAVALSSSGVTGGTSSGDSSAGGCPYPVQFTISLIFAPSSTTAAVAATATPSTTTTSSTTAAPATATATSTTGAAQ